MDSCGIRFLGHNIPPVLPIDFSSIFAFRIQNALCRDIYFQSHGSFYGNPMNDTAFKLSVLLNGDLLTNVLVYNDCIHSGQRVTLFFPFRTREEGQYRLQIFMAEQHVEAISDDKHSLFEMSLQVKRNFSGFNLTQKVRHGLFTFLYSKSPGWPD